MVMPKLPLIVPKRPSPPIKASDSTFNASNTTNVTGDTNLPSKNPNPDNYSTNFSTQKLTKLVSNSTLNLKKSPSTHSSVNTVNNSDNDNSNFYEDLSLRLNSSTILSDLNATPNYQNTTTTTNNNKEDEMDEDEVGYTPWLKVEKRINEIRSFYSHMNRNTPNATNNTSNTTSSNKDGEKKSVYSNYRTKYIEDGWNKEIDHPLKYATIQKLKAKKSYENDFKDNWKFVNGFLRPRRKPFTSISEMSKYYNKVDAKDQYEMIRLLLACRDLERLIEEQHTVLAMLDHDLREARDSFSDLTNAFNGQKLFGSGPKNEPQYPTADVPLFIKGRLSLLPNQ